jgi:hypothetical protein
VLGRDKADRAFGKHTTSLPGFVPLRFALPRRSLAFSCELPSGADRAPAACRKPAFFLIFRGKTPRKKQHARAKKVFFPLETRFFSSSIRSARGECRFSLVINQLLEGNNHGNCEKSCGEKSTRKEGPGKEGCTG